MFTKDFVKPQPVRPMIPDSVRYTVRAAQDAGRLAEERANLDMPFRARLRARDGVRPQSTLAIISGIENQVQAKAKPATPPRGPIRPLRFVPANPGFLALGKNGKGGILSGGGNDDDDGGNRLSDISQFAFAGIAVLGLAGLSVMAAESALHSGTQGNAGPLADVPPSLAPGGGAASSVAMAAASTPSDAVPTAWFDYRGLADRLAANQAAYETTQRDVATAESEQTRLQAASVIADVEARRVAKTAAQDADAEQARLAAAELEKTRLAEAEAARVAEAEQVRLANLKAEQDAAAAIEAQRLADLETRRLAEAEAETRRLADLKAKADAKAEQKRLAALAVENQKKRLAAAAAAEETRLAAVTASAILPAASPRLATPAPTPLRTRQMVAHTGAVPPPATLKPAGAGVILAALSAPVTRPVPPPSYTLAAPTVRPFNTAPAPVTARNVDAFMAERVELTAAQALDSEMINTLRADFLRLVDTQADGATQTLKTPDGRDLTILIERSTNREASKSTVRTIEYTAQPTDSVVRFVSDVIPMKVSVMCRDIAYAFPGQERGRFAACQAPEGGWVLARATDTGALPLT
ncbi:MAG: hypothetical protein KKC43_13260 [Alphaproteobacteria bacterium]|nr:hypothetical protein [Alphaproteobacteria bacterium]